MPLLCAALITAGASYAKKKYGDNASEKGKSEVPNLKSKTKVELLPMECTLALFETPICTVTFFQGNSSVAAEYLQGRVDKIVAANPWLSGYIAYDPPPADEKKSGSETKNSENEEDKRFHLWYDENPQAELSETSRRLFVSFPQGQIPLSQEKVQTPYSDYGKILNPDEGESAIIPTNSECLRDPLNTTLFKLSLIPDVDRPAHKFALVMSMSHVCGDAHTYYKILNMLSEEQPVESLNPVRKMNFDEAVGKVMGEQEATYLHGKSFDDDDNSTKSMSADERVKRMKENFRKTVERAESALKKREQQTDDDEVGRTNALFVVSDEWLQAPMSTHLSSSIKSTVALSANDVITHWLFSSTNATVGLMPFNFRNPRFANMVPCRENDAGNYVNPIAYTPRDYATPELIRQSLETACRNGSSTRRAGNPEQVDDPLPALTPDTKFSISVSWTAFMKKDLSLPSDGSEVAKQVAHVPYKPIDVNSLKRTKLSFVILFRFKEGKIGALISAPKRYESLVRSCGIADEYIANF